LSPLSKQGIHATDARKAVMRTLPCNKHFSWY